MIAKERQEQIEKHGWTVSHDREMESDLDAVAVAIIEQDRDRFPSHWEAMMVNNILGKSVIERLAIAGAMIAAEIDRLKTFGTHSIND